MQTISNANKIEGEAASLSARFMEYLTPDGECPVRREPPTTAHAILCHILLLQSVLERTANRITETHGLTFTQWMALSCASHGGQTGITHSQLSRRLMLSKAPITGVVDRLEKVKLVRRMADRQDRRVSRIVITDEGLRLWDAVRDELEEHSRRLFADLPAPEQELLLPLLARLLSSAIQEDPMLAALTQESTR